MQFVGIWPQAFRWGDLRRTIVNKNELEFPIMTWLLIKCNFNELLIDHSFYRSLCWKNTFCLMFFTIDFGSLIYFWSSDSQRNFNKMPTRIIGLWKDFNLHVHDFFPRCRFTIIFGEVNPLSHCNSFAILILMFISHQSKVSRSGNFCMYSAVDRELTTSRFINLFQRVDHGYV